MCCCVRYRSVQRQQQQQATKRTTSKIDWSILKSERYCRGKGGDSIGNRPNRDKEPHKGSGTLVRRAVIPTGTLVRRAAIPSELWAIVAQTRESMDGNGKMNATLQGMNPVCQAVTFRILFLAKQQSRLRNLSLGRRNLIRPHPA